MELFRLEKTLCAQPVAVQRLVVTQGQDLALQLIALYAIGLKC